MYSAEFNVCLIINSRTGSIKIYDSHIVIGHIYCKASGNKVQELHTMEIGTDFISKVIK